MNFSYLKWQRIEKSVLYKVFNSATPLSVQYINNFSNRFKHWLDLTNLLIFNLSHRDYENGS